MPFKKKVFSFGRRILSHLSFSAKPASLPQRDFFVSFSPLPEPLVQRLRILVKEKSKTHRGRKRIYSFLGSRKNIDHRKKSMPKKAVPETDTKSWGRRIRSFDISRNYPGTELVVKRVHGKLSAERLIFEINKKVVLHNSSKKNLPYELLKLPAHAIGVRLLVMPRIEAPTVDEMLDPLERTKRGKVFLKKLKQAGFSERLLKNAALEAKKNSGFSQWHLWCLGARKGNFVFMPLADLS